MPLRCIPDGVATLIRLSAAPRREEPQALGASARRALGLWQARRGEILTVLAPDGAPWRARVTRLEAEAAEVVPFQSLPQPVESPLDLNLAQALPERERFELVLQKLTELGVNRIVPLRTERSSTTAERDREQRKSHRWPDVLQRAARQCRRARLPELAEETPLEDLLATLLPAARVLVLSEHESACRLRDAAPPAPGQPLWLIVGPEGGFTPAEVATMAARGATAVTLGGRLLRTETAAIAAAALMQHRFGDVG